jgi:hypothetical protein
LDQNPWLQLAATLSKPFTRDELLGAVKAALSATAMTASAQNLARPVLAEAVIHRLSHYPNGQASHDRVWPNE